MAHLLRRYGLTCFVVILFWSPSRLVSRVPIPGPKHKVRLPLRRRGPLPRGPPVRGRPLRRAGGVGPDVGERGSETRSTRERRGCGQAPKGQLSQNPASRLAEFGLRRKSKKRESGEVNGLESRWSSVCLPRRPDTTLARNRGWVRTCQRVSGRWRLGGTPFFMVMGLWRRGTIY